MNWNSTDKDVLPHPEDHSLTQKSALGPSVSAREEEQQLSAKLEQIEIPSPILAPIYLFIRPREFFRHFVQRSIPALSVFAFWLTGIVSTADRIESKIGSFQHKGELLMFVEHWGVFWLVCAILGALSGFFYFLLGGWWYRKRLEICGADEPDPDLARRVYVYAFLAYVIPAFVYLLWQTSAFSTPAEAMMDENLYVLILMFFLLWSTYTSYRGAITVFTIRKIAARVWFFILPTLLYLLIFGGGAVAAILIVTNPDVDHPHTIDQPAYKLYYPGNWELNKSDPDFDYDEYFQISPPFADAIAQFNFGTGIESPEQWADIVKDSYIEAMNAETLKEQQIDHWGKHTGYGLRLSLKAQGGIYDGLIFVNSSDKSNFLTIEFCLRENCQKLEPGFKLIRDSFALKPTEP